MSIISEALKKAQEKRAEDIAPIGQSTITPTNRIAPILNGHRGTSKTPVVNKGVLITAGIVVSVFIVLFFIFAYFVTKVQREAILDAVGSKQTTVSETTTPSNNNLSSRTYGISNKLPTLTGIMDSFNNATSKMKLPTLSGIMYSAGNPIAIMNGKSVSEGDVVAGYTIENILPYKVTVSRENKKYELKLNL